MMEGPLDQHLGPYIPNKAVLEVIHTLSTLDRGFTAFKITHRDP